MVRRVGFQVRLLVSGLLMMALPALQPTAAEGQSVTSATISGAVHDPSGALVRGAIVTLRHRATNYTAETTTDERGQYRLSYAPVRVSEDRWSIAGCPDDGPALAIDGRDRVHVVWPTVVSEDGGPRKVLFHAMSTDGVTFSPRERIPTEGHASHPQVSVINAGVLAVAWDESGDGGRRLALARGSVDAGKVTFRRDVRAASVSGVYPVLASTADATLLMAWTSGDPANSTIRATRMRSSDLARRGEWGRWVR